MELSENTKTDLGKIATVSGTVWASLYPKEKGWDLYARRDDSSGQTAQGHLTRTSGGYSFRAIRGALTFDREWKPLIDRALRSLR